MKIGLNGQMLLIDKFAGPEVYTFNVFKNLALYDKINKYIVYFRDHPTKEFWSELSNNNPNFSYKIISNKISWTQCGLLWELVREPVDIFFSATHTIPIFHHPKTKFVSMIHGLEHKINRQYERGTFKYLVHPIILWWVLTFSKIIIVPSQATKKAIISNNFWLLSSKKIMIISEGVNKNFYQRNKQEITNIKNKYRIDFDKYLIFVSTIQPRKNIPIMVNAFSQVIHGDESFRNTGLIICGKIGWLHQESINAPQKYNIENNVKFLGRVPDEDLPMLLSGAEYFISLSLEEGFGLPLLEAMSCKIPAIVSDISAFKEIGEDTQIYVDPTDLKKIKNTINKCLIEKINYDKINKAYTLSKNYSWENTAQKLISVFNSVYENR